MLVLVVLLTSIVPLAAFAEENYLSGQLPSGTSYSEIENAIDDFVAAHEDTTAGMSVSVFTAQDTLMEKSYGYANIEDNVINDADTVFIGGRLQNYWYGSALCNLSSRRSSI